MKKILTAVSVFALISGSNSAVAQDRAIISDWDFSGNGFKDGQPFQNEDGVTYHEMGLSGYNKSDPLQPGALLKYINLNNNIPGSFYLYTDMKLGSVVNHQGDKLRIIYSEAEKMSLTLTGDGDGMFGVNSNDYSSLGDIIMVQPNSVLIIDANDHITLESVITENLGSSINVERNGVSFTGGVGNDKYLLQEINFKAPSKNEFFKDVYAENIYLHGEPIYLSIGNGVSIFSNINSKDSTGGEIYFQGANTVTGEVGGSMAVHLISINGGGVLVNSNVASKEIQFNGPGSDLTVQGFTDANVIYNQFGTLNVHGTTSGSVDFRGQEGRLVVGNGVSVNSTIDDSVSGCMGSVELTGHAILFGRIGATNPIKEIIAKGPGSVVIHDSVRSCLISISDPGVVMDINGELTADNVSFDAAGILHMNNNITGDIDFRGNDGLMTLGDGYKIAGNVYNMGAIAAGTLEFKGSGAVTGTIGNKNYLKAIKSSGAGEAILSGADTKAQTVTVSNNDSIINITGALAAEDLIFAANGEIIVNSNLGASNIIATKGVTDAQLTVSGDQKLTGQIDGFGTLHVNGNYGIDLQPTNTDLSGVKFTTENNGEGLIEINKDGLLLGDIGSTDYKFGTVSFNQDAQTSEVYAMDVAIADGSLIQFNGNIEVTNGIVFNGPSAEALFNSGDIKAQLISSGGGIVGFNNANIMFDVGSNSSPFTEVNFITNNSSSNIAASIYANKINVNNQNILNIQNDVTFAGDLKLVNSTLNIGSSDLVLTKGTSSLVDPLICIDTNSGNHGHLIAGDGTTLEISGGIKIDMKQFGTLPLNVKEIDLIMTQGSGLLDFSPLTMNVTKAGSAFTDWEIKSSSTGVKLVAKQTTGGGTGGTGGGTGGGGGVTPEIIEEIFGYTPGTQGEEVVKQLRKITSSAKRKEAIHKLLNKNSKKATHHKVVTSAHIHKKLLDRVQKIDGAGAFLSAPSAGDENGTHGTWVAPFYSHTVKSKETDNSGYRANAYGAMIGADTKVSDDVTLGGSFTYVNSDIDYKDVKNGDTSKIDSYMLSGYANMEFENDWFAHGILTAGIDKVKDTDQRILSNLTLGTAYGDYDSKLFVAEARVGTNYQLPENNLIITPALGMAFSESKDDAYTETGTAGVQLLSVGKKSYERLDIVGSMKLATNASNYAGFELKPEFIATLSYDLLDHGDSVNRTIPGLDLPADTLSNQEQFYGTAGVNINAYKNAIEYSVGVNQTFAKHYYNVTGSLNIRVNF